MILVYWGAQFIPSGWISIIFGLSPIITGVVSSIFFRGEFFSAIKLFSLLLAVVGLIIIFGHSANLGEYAAWGISAVLLSTIIHSLAALMIKNINVSISGMQITYGGLLIAVPLFALVTLFSRTSLPDEIMTLSWYAIVYLGIVATAIGFPLYYFVLGKLDAIRVSMITLITPMTALLLGAMLNGEALTATVLLGAGMILLGLTLYEYDRKIARLLFE